MIRLTAVGRGEAAEKRLPHSRNLGRHHPSATRTAKPNLRPLEVAGIPNLTHFANTERRTRSGGRQLRHPIPIPVDGIGGLTDFGTKMSFRRCDDEYLQYHRLKNKFYVMDGSG